MVLLWCPTGWRFLISEVPLYRLLLVCIGLLTGASPPARPDHCLPLPRVFTHFSSAWHTHIRRKETWLTRQ